MLLEYRVLGMAALAVDVAFALLVLLWVAVIMECGLRQVWASRPMVLLAGAGLLLLVLWAANSSVSVSR